LQNSDMSVESSAPRTLQAGIARVIITPPIGIRLWGYTVQEGCSQAVERELTATVLVLTDGMTSAVLIGLDLLFVPLPISDRIRAAIGRQIDIPEENVLLNGSHTHLGPMLPGWQAEESPQQDLQAQYVDHLERVLVDAASSAWARRQPARIGTGHGSAPLGVNRREKLPADGIIIGENPDGPIDRTVDVIRIDDLAGRPIAVVMSAACHTVVLGPKTLSYSPDFIGLARELIEPAIGAPSLFLQGAAGNINPACGIGSGGAEQMEDLQRMGLMLGGETLKVWSQIRTHNQRGPRRVVRSVARISTWDYEPTPQATIEHFSVARRRLNLPLASLPDPPTAETDLERTRAARDAALAGDSLGPKHVTQRMYAWAEQRHRLVSAGHTIVTREIELWALRINNLGIASVSAEPLAELGLEIKRRSPLPHTLFLGYSNGCIGYIPPPEAFAEGGMEVVESHYNYLLASQLTPEWAPTVIETTLEMLAGL
jgi:neutral ceramidase